MPNSQNVGLRHHLDFINFDHLDRRALDNVVDILLHALPKSLDSLYEKIGSVPSLSGIFQDAEQKRHAREGQEQHWRKMLSSDFQGDYLADMRRIGRAHAKVGVEPNWLVGAYSILLSDAFARLDMELDDRSRDSAKIALLKLFMTDIYYAVAVYHDEMRSARDRLERQQAVLMEKQGETLEVFQDALSQLSRGNLDFQIKARLPVSFRATAEQFNKAIRKQRQLVRTAERRATYDPLTGLFNRQHFFGLAEEVLGLGSLRQNLRLEAIDLDGFKLINDTLGHDAGDFCLKAFATRLRKTYGKAAKIFRLGGDEFAIIRKLSGHRRSSAFYQFVMAEMEKPIFYADTSITLGASIGYVDPADYQEDNSKELLRKADLALYAAKRAGKGQVQQFTPELLLKAMNDSQIIRECRRAAAQGRLKLHYQPKIDLRTGHLSGLEALVRMVDDDGNLLNASSFAPALQDGSCQRLIGDFVLDQSVAAIKEFKRCRVDFRHIAINLGTLQFAEPSIVQQLGSLLEAGEIDSGDLQVEVTEDIILSNSVLDIESALERLAALGIKIALDDFGTGYASLRHLQSFPIDIVKIDRGFIAGLSQSPQNLQIVSAVIGLSRSLEKEVVAEGIDSVEDAEILRSLGCVHGQGYLFSPAVPLEEIKRQYPAQLTKPIVSAA